MATQVQKAADLLSLHQPGDPLVLLNVWDVASALVVASNPQTHALATASWSVAAALGYPDGGGLPLDRVVDLSQRIAASTELPVTVDFEKGYATDLEDLATNVRRLCATGIVGINLEDSVSEDDGPLWSVRDAAERVATAREAARSEGLHLVINARTDVLLGGGSTDDAIVRGHAYLEAGADCIFVLGAIGPDLITIVREISGPVSVLAGAGDPSISQLAEAGVARISVGPGSMGVAMSALKQLATQIQTGGEWPASMSFRP